MADATTETKQPDVAFPDRADDGCTHCGAILTVFDRNGDVDVAGCEAAQQRHAANASCVATPNTNPDQAREVNKKTGRLDGEYAPHWKR